MICPKCKARNPDGVKFCNECATRLSGSSHRSGAEAEPSLGQVQTVGPVQAPAQPAAPPSIGDMATLPPSVVGPEAAEVAAAPVARGRPPGLQCRAVEPEPSIGDQPTAALSPAARQGAAVASSGTALAERYEVLEEIGRGGFAVVCKARDRKLDRLVAVKRLAPDGTEGRQGELTVARFVREAQAIASLNHRNIVQVFDHDRDGDGHYIVMEYVDGGTLRDLLQAQGRLPVAEAVRLVTGICQGLAFAHKRNLVHRDIKPANILLARDGDTLVPKIVDFGLARVGADTGTSVTGYGMGTPYYMPPEQRRDAKSVNHTADIYALGKTLYELLTCEVPDNVDPELVPPPPELARVILKCVKSRPEDRYFSVEDLIRDLEALAGRGPAALALGKPGASGGVCPNCRAANLDDAKFCEGCGTGLTRRCPECDLENSVHKQFCRQCGTDVTTFLQAQDALGRMHAYTTEKKWSRVTKEFGLLPQHPKLPGAKGANLLPQLAELNAQAEGKLAERAALREQLDTLVAAQEFEKAVDLAGRLIAVDPHDDATQALRRAIPGHIDARDFRRAQAQGAAALERQDLAAAKAAIAAYLEAHTDGAHAPEAHRLLDRDLTALALLAEFRDHLTTKRYDPALATAERLRQVIGGSFAPTPRPEGTEHPLDTPPSSSCVGQTPRGVAQTTGHQSEPAQPLTRSGIGPERAAGPVRQGCRGSAPAEPAIDVPILGVGPTLAAVVGEVETGCAQIAEFARQAAAFEREAALAEAETRLVAAAALWRQAESVYPGRGTGPQALERVNTAAAQARSAFDQFTARLRAAVEMFEAKDLGACREALAEVDRLQQALQPPADAEWLADWQAAVAARHGLEADLSASEQQLAELVATAEGHGVASRLATALEVLLQAERLSPLSEVVRAALGRIRGEIEATEARFVQLREGAAMAARLLEQKKIESCRGCLAEVDRLADLVRPPAGGEWRGEWETVAITLSELEAKVASAETEVAAIAEEVATALAAQHYQVCLERARAAGDWTVEPPAALLDAHERARATSGQVATLLETARHRLAEGDWAGAEAASLSALNLHQINEAARALQAAAIAGRERRRHRQRTLLIGLAAVFVLVGLVFWLAAQVRFHVHCRGFERAATAGKIEDSLRLARIVQDRYAPAREFLSSCGRLRKAQCGASGAREEAVVAGAIRYAPDLWLEATRLADHARGAYPTGHLEPAASVPSRPGPPQRLWPEQLASAAGFWEQAERAYLSAAAGAREKQTRARLADAAAKAEQAKARDDWGQVLKEAEAAALASRPGSVEGQELADALTRLAAEARGRLAPRLEVTAELDGNDVVGAEVTLTPVPSGPGEQAVTMSGVAVTNKTPCILDLEAGMAYWVEVTLPARDGHEYEVQKCRIDAAPGTKHWRVLLRAVPGPAQGQLWVVPGLEHLAMEFVPIRAGEFRMGSENGEVDERPVHRVVIGRPFWMSRTEVTNGQYRQFVQSGYDGRSDADRTYLKHWQSPTGLWAQPADDSYPVVAVGWKNAVRFCDWLTELERAAGRLRNGYAYRLPTEAEWEYACRAGSGGDYAVDARSLDEHAWYHRGSSARNDSEGTHAVGSKKANAWGLCDMHGNVYEWCWDLYAPYPGSALAETGRRPAIGGEQRVFRGGSWYDAENCSRSAKRFRAAPERTRQDVGFRAVLAPEIPTQPGTPSE